MSVSKIFANPFFHLRRNGTQALLDIFKTLRKTRTQQHNMNAGCNALEIN
jgi:hypothetical protein